MGVGIGAGMISIAPTTAGDGTRGEAAKDGVVGEAKQCKSPDKYDEEEGLRESICRLTQPASRRSLCWERSALIGGQCRAGLPESPFPYP